MTGRRGIRCKQLLVDLKETRRYWKLKVEAPDVTLYRDRFERGYGPTVGYCDLNERPAWPPLWSFDRIYSFIFSSLLNERMNIPRKQKSIL
jgi:hypothetical protein